MFDNTLDISHYNRASGKKLKKGGKVVTWKHKYNKKYGYPLTESHSLKEISKDTGISMKGLKQIYKKGVGAFKTNPSSVRKNVRSSQQWAMGRVYSAVMGGKASDVDAKELKMEKGGLTKGKSHDEGGIKMVVKSTGQRVELEGGEGVLNKKVMSDDKKYNFEGKDMTACDIASELNQQKGDGVAFECDDVEGKFEEGGSVNEFEFGGLVGDDSDNKFVYNEIVNSIFDPNFEDFDYIADRFYDLWWRSVFYQQTARFIEGKQREYNRKFYPYGKFSDILMEFSFYSTAPLNNAKEEQFIVSKILFEVSDNFKLDSKTDFLSNRIKKKIKKNFIERCQSLQSEITNRKVEGYIIKNPHHCTIDVRFEKGYKTRLYRFDQFLMFPFVMPSGEKGKTLDCYKLSTIYNENPNFLEKPPRASKVITDYLQRSVGNTEFRVAQDFQKLLNYPNLNLDDDSQYEEFFDDVRRNRNLFSIENREGRKDDYSRFFDIQKKPIGTNARDYVLQNLPPFILSGSDNRFQFTATFSKIFTLGEDTYQEIREDKDAITNWFKNIYTQFYIEAPKFFNCVSIDNVDIEEEIIYTDDPTFLDLLADIVFRIALESGQSYQNFVRAISNIKFLNANLHPSRIDQQLYNRTFMSVRMFTLKGSFGVNIPYIFLYEGEIDQSESQLRQKQADETAKLKKIKETQIGFKRLLGNIETEAMADSLEKNIQNQVALFDYLDYPKDKKYIKLLNDDIRKNINKYSSMGLESLKSLPLNLLEYYYNQARQSPVLPLGKPCELPTPNGAKSKLPLQTYLAVRSPFFKIFFGDWERAYETDNYRNVSRVIDADTKEPRIMYHGVRKFVQGFGSFANMGEGVKRPYGEFNPPNFPASYFGDNLEYVEFYGGNAKNMRKPSSDYKGFYYSVFLNMRNPIDLRPLGFKTTFKDFIDYLFVKYGIVYQKEASIPQLRKGEYKVWVFVRNHPDLLDLMKRDGFDGIIQDGDVPKYDKDGKISGSKIDTEYLTFYSSQIESASVKNNLYLGVFEDIRFKRGGNVSI